MSELTEMEKHLQKMFTQCGHDLQKKFLKYTQDFQRLEAQKQAAVDRGDMTEEEFAEWRKNKLLYGMHWRRLIDRNTAELVKYNETAVKYINGETPQIFAAGYNSVAEKIPDSPVGGFDFELINANTVSNLIHEEGITLPKKKLDPQKDKQWNAKQINAQILQGIMQGESIPKMAKRMQTVANSDLAGATRTARTMHTAAQNCGRQAGYNKAAKEGAIFVKVWLAAHDDRTRSSHAEMDGQTVAYDEMFVSPSGAELEFPGDWRAPAEEVYNCRCTMITKFQGFKKLKDTEDIPDRETPKGNKAEDYEWIESRQTAEKFSEKDIEIIGPAANIETQQQFISSDYSPQARAYAARFAERKEADKLHRPYLDSVWNSLEDSEKYAIWQYTKDSDPMNVPLSGYESHYDRGNFVGVINSDWSDLDVKRSLPPNFEQYGVNGEMSNHKVITDLTKAIEKSVLPQNTVLVRNTNIDGLVGLIESEVFSFDFAEQLLSNGSIEEIKKAFEGATCQNHAFTSTSIAKDSLPKNSKVIYEIYAPKGTKGIYAEPQSYWGDTTRSKAELYQTGKPYSKVGDEAEIILQRGTKFEIKEIEKNQDGVFVVKMDIVEQPDYFKHGDENTIDNGQTRHAKGKKD